MKELVRGGNHNFGSPAVATTYTVSVESRGVPVDVYALVANGVVGANPELMHPENALVFGRNPSFEGVRLAAAAAGTAQFTVPSSALPDNRYVRFVATVDPESEEAQGTVLDDVEAFEVTVSTPDGDRIVYSPENWGQGVTAGVLGELYNKAGSDAIRFRADGTGWDGGIVEMLRAHGGDVTLEPQTAAEEAQKDVPQFALPASPATTPSSPPAFALPAQPSPPPAFAPPAPAPAPAWSPPAPPTTAPAAPKMNLQKQKIVLSKDTPDEDRVVHLDLTKGDPSWVLTIELQWDGRGAQYRHDGSVKRFGEGDLDVYFYCRDEQRHRYVVVSGETGRKGTLHEWPFAKHSGDVKSPGEDGLPASERLIMRPSENGHVLLNLYQAVDNGADPINAFGNPRAVIRYGPPGNDGLPGLDADEITIYPGNSEDSYWVTVADVDVRNGVLVVDGRTRYSDVGVERMPGLTKKGRWVGLPKDGPTGQSKIAMGDGLDRYEGPCHRHGLMLNGFLAGL